MALDLSLNSEMNDLIDAVVETMKDQGFTFRKDPKILDENKNSVEFTLYFSEGSDMAVAEGMIYDGFIVKAMCRGVRGEYTLDVVLGTFSSAGAEWYTTCEHGAR